LPSVAASTCGAALEDVEVLAQPLPAVQALLELLEEDLLGLVGAVGDVDDVDVLARRQLEERLRVAQAQQHVDQVEHQDRAEVVLAGALAPQQRGDLVAAGGVVVGGLVDVLEDPLGVAADQRVDGVELAREDRRQVQVLAAE
jgi:hypothetical protein